MQLWEILVPTKTKDNIPIRTRHHKNWDAFVRKVTGGLTIHKPGKGQWIEPASGTLIEERVIPVRIACTRSQIGKIIDFTLLHYKQKAVMAYLISTEVILKYAEDKDGNQVENKLQIARKI